MDAHVVLTDLRDVCEFLKANCLGRARGCSWSLKSSHCVTACLAVFSYDFFAGSICISLGEPPEAPVQGCPIL